MRFSKQTITDESEQTDAKWLSYTPESVIIEKFESESSELLSHGTVLFIESNEESTNVTKGFIPVEKTMKYFGVSLGLMPILAFTIRALSQPQNEYGLKIAILVIGSLIALAMSISGYHIDRLFNRFYKGIFDHSIIYFLLASILIGIACGFLIGALGGLFVFVFGAIYGALIGGVLGGLLFPIYSSLIKLYEKDGFIKTIYPISFALAIGCVLMALIFGFKN